MFKNDGYGSFGGLASTSIPIEDADVIVVGVPYEAGTSGKKGTSFAPKELRLFSKDLQLMSRRGVNLSNIKIKDVGDINVYPQNEDLHRISIEKSIKFLLESSNALIICVGGDHSITFPEINAYSKFGLVGVIWIDAHRDVLDELNNSKYSHGSSLRRAIENKSVLPDNVLLIGTRYMEASETEFIQKYGISELSMVEIEESHRKRILIKDKILKLANSVDLIFLSIDIDVVDPAYAPGTGTPVAGGMTSNLLLNIIHDFPSPIRGLDIVEVSPPLDPSGITTKLQMAMITELCAKVI